MIEAIKSARSKGKRVYIIGNGGSACNAEHIACDLLACNVRAFALTSLGILTATANDIGYHWIFAQQLQVYADPGDILIALSGSGKSPNILNACDVAEVLGMKVFRYFGAEMSLDMQESEEAQIVLGHQLRKELA